MKPMYEEIARRTIAPNCEAVLSRHSKGGYTLARVMMCYSEWGGDPVPTYMKGSFHFKDVAGILCLRDLLDDVLEKLGVDS